MSTSRRNPPTPRDPASDAIQLEIHRGPDEADARAIWKYLDLVKLIWLLEHAQLFFTRADCFGDPFEGAATAGTLRERDATAAWYAVRSFPDQASAWRSRVRRKFGLSCWHLSDHESQAMWRNYADRGIALVSTVGRFATALTPRDKGQLYFGAVRYVDHRVAGAVREEDPPVPLFFKNLGFEHEHEYRAALLWQPERPDTLIEGGGTGIDVDIGTLIEKFVLSPDLRPFEAEAIRAVVDRYGVAEVVESSLTDAPTQ